MANFLETLKSRREAARLRLEVARQNLDAAEANVRKWSDAVELEEHDANRNEQATEQLRTLTIDSVRRKEDILRAALRTAGRPLRPSEILKMVKPAMSRASVYLLVKQMKAAGDLNEYAGKFSLISNNDNRHHVVARGP